MNTQKIAIIFGASDGIGAAICRFLAAKNWQVIAVARRAEMLDELAKASKNIKPLQGDVSSEEYVSRAIDEAKKLGKVSAIVLTAGAYKYGKTLAESPEEWWEATLQTNIIGCKNVIQEAERLFIEQRHGLLVSVSSFGGNREMTWPRRAFYSASKAFMTSLTTSVYLELRKFSAQATTISPGLVLTAMTADWVEKNPGTEDSGITPEFAGEQIGAFVDQPFDTPALLLDRHGLRPDPVMESLDLNVPDTV